MNKKCQNKSPGSPINGSLTQKLDKQPGYLYQLMLLVMLSFKYSRSKLPTQSFGNIVHY